MKLLLLLALLSILLGCISSAPSNNSLNTAYLEESCINLCKMSLDKNVNLTSGPCLGLIATDWVCDVAHNPRQEIDNLSENRCEYFANKTAHHFVEVDEYCNLIQSN